KYLGMKWELTLQNWRRDINYVLDDENASYSEAWVNILVSFEKILEVGTDFDFSNISYAQDVITLLKVINNLNIIFGKHTLKEIYEKHIGVAYYFLSLKEKAIGQGLYGLG
ncbi:MAG TPA: hypothetical protein PLZ51_14575, partial [Aggregatilineales bacterium]|nr:hypothetical protein [Aggregatilineales bacterium]